MDAKKARQRKQAQKRRTQLRIRTGCYPPSWKRYLVAGATVCHSLRVLAEEAHQRKRGEDEHDST